MKKTTNILQTRTRPTIGQYHKEPKKGNMNAKEKEYKEKEKHQM